MLFQETFNDPHMEVNGVVKKVSNDFWAQKTLSPEEYQLFKAAEHRQKVMWNNMLANGRAEVTRDTNTDSTTITLYDHVFHDPEYTKYMRQMLRDPTVTWPGSGIKPIY